MNEEKDMKVWEKEIKSLLVKQEKGVRAIYKIVEDLDSSQLKVEKNAFDAINSSDTSLNLVKGGMEGAERMIKKFDALYQAVEESNLNVKKMEELSKMIEGFAGVIAGISSKTNMLSLNASIEAARAGEQGRGFAVVANEVRTLASQSATSSKEISSTIQMVQSSVSNMVNDLSSIYEIVKEQNQLITDVGEVFKKILDAAYTTNDVAHSVEGEIAFQRGITDNAVRTIQDMNDTMDSISYKIEQI